tara:strand:+ start:5800 stop:6156 length:357 start_codon:yes stop_codon:yes gene_type:complete
MSSTITASGVSITPALIDGYKSSRESRNVVHDILGSNVPAITLRSAGTRTGTLTALFETLAEAKSLEDVLSSADVLQFADTDNDELLMDFVVDGDITVELEDGTRALWLVEFDFQEVA